MTKKLKDINLLEGYDRTTKKRDSTIRIYSLLLVLEVCIVALFVSIYTARIVTTNNYLKKLSEEISIKQNQMAEIEKFVQKRNLFIQKEAFYKYIVQDHEKLLDILEKLENITPTSMKYESLNLTKDKVTCVVRADKLETVVQFVYNMQVCGYFQNIAFSGGSGDDKSKTSTITVGVVGK